MYEFRLEIAGIIIGLRSTQKLEKNIVKQLRLFKSTKVPQIVFEVTPQPLQVKYPTERSNAPVRYQYTDSGDTLFQSHLFQVCWKKSSGTIAYPVYLQEHDAYLQHRGLLGAIKALWTYLFTKRGGQVLHASAVAQGQGALLFAGVDEAGKTTVAKMLSPAPILNDDVVGVYQSGAGEFSVCATPFVFDGEPHKPLERKIVMAFALNQSTETKTVPMKRTDSLRTLLASVILPEGCREFEARALGDCLKLAESVLWHELHFTLDPQKTSLEISQCLRRHGLD